MAGLLLQLSLSSRLYAAMLAEELRLAIYRSQQSLEDGSKVLTSLAGTQQQMEEMSARLSRCAADLNAAKQHIRTTSSKHVQIT